MLERRQGRQAGKPISRVKRRRATAGPGRPPGQPPNPPPASPAPDAPSKSSTTLSRRRGQAYDAPRITPAENAVIDAASSLPLRRIQTLTAIGRHRLATLRTRPHLVTLHELARLQAAGLILLSLVAVPRRGAVPLYTHRSSP